MTRNRQGTSESFARDVLGCTTSFFGPVEVRSFLMINMEGRVPPIPFTKERLIRARDLGQSLYLFPDKDTRGKPLTIKGVCEILGNEVRGCNLFCLPHKSPFEEEAFYDEPIVPKPTWRLVTDDVIPFSLERTHVRLLGRIADYLQHNVYRGIELPKPYCEALKEFEDEKDKLKKMRKDRWKKVAEGCAQLKISELFRETVGQTVFRLGIYLHINYRRLLSSVGTVSKSFTRGGVPFSVGPFESVVGIHFDSFPCHGDPGEGVCFSEGGLES